VKFRRVPTRRCLRTDTPDTHRANPSPSAHRFIRNEGPSYILRLLASFVVLVQPQSDEAKFDFFGLYGRPRLLPPPRASMARLRRSRSEISKATICSIGIKLDDSPKPVGTRQTTRPGHRTLQGWQCQTCERFRHSGRMLPEGVPTTLLASRYSCTNFAVPRAIKGATPSGSIRTTT